MKNRKEYKAIIFDLDGTLYFQKPLRVFMAINMGLWLLFHLPKKNDFALLSKFRKVRENWLEIVKGMDGLSEGETLIQAHYRHAIKGSDISADYMDCLVREWMDEKPLKFLAICRDKTLCRMIENFRRKGSIIVVYSDCPIGKKLQALSLEVDYEFSAYDDEISTMKPDKKGLEVILQTINFLPTDVLMVGDRMEKDGQAALQVGMDYLILERTYWKRKKQMQSMVGRMYD